MHYLICHSIVLQNVGGVTHFVRDRRHYKSLHCWKLIVSSIHSLLSMMAFYSLNIQWYVINRPTLPLILTRAYIREIKHPRLAADADGLIWVLSDHEFLIVSENFLFRNSNGEFYLQGYISTIDFSHIDVMHFNNLTSATESIRL